MENDLNQETLKVNQALEQPGDVGDSGGDDDNQEEINDRI